MNMELPPDYRPPDPDREERWGMALVILCCAGFFGGGGFILYCILR